MTGPELKAQAIKLFGPKRWTTRLAIELHVTESTIYRYANHAEVPYLVAEKMKQLAGEV